VPTVTPTAAAHRAARLLSLAWQHGPAVLCALVGLAALADGVRVAQRWWIHPPSRAASRGRAEHPGATASPPAALNAAGLFGAEAAGAAAQPLEDANLVLVGVVALPDPRQGYAILGPSAASVQSYRAGGTLPGMYTLAEVYPDRVVLERAGAARVLYLPHADLAKLLGTLPRNDVPAPVSEAEAQAADAAVQAALEKDKLFMMAAGEWTFGGVNPKPRIVGGRLTGVILNPSGTDAEVAARAGIRYGDLLTEIDGQPLPDLAHLPQRLRALEGRGQVQLTVQHTSGETAIVVVSLPVVEHDDG